MISVSFRENGFSVSGHATENAKDIEGKILCSAVSSASYMAANTITEVLKLSANIQISDGFMSFSCENPDCHIILEGFKLHITELSKEHSERIRII